MKKITTLLVLMSLLTLSIVMAQGVVEVDKSETVQFILNVLIVAVSGTITMFLQWWRKNREEDDQFDLRKHWKSIALFFAIGIVANIIAYVRGADPNMVFQLLLGLSGLQIQFAVTGAKERSLV